MARRGGSWSVCLFGGEASNADQVPLLATRTDAGLLWSHRVRAWVCVGHDRFGMVRDCRALELQQEASTGSLLAPGRMPKAEVADLVQSLGQHVLQEPTHELVARHAGGSPAIGFAVLVTDGDRLVVKADDACVGDGDAKHVAGEIVEHGLLTLTPSGAMDDPRFGPNGLRQNQVGSACREPRPELAAHELGQRFDRHQEVVACWMP
jgi:hypothetical protein